LVTKVSDIFDSGPISGQFKVEEIPTASGLVRNFSGGTLVRLNTVSAIAGAQITVADDATTYVYINTNTLAIESGATIPTEDRVLMYRFVAASGVITTTEDWRIRSTGIVDTS